MNKDIRCMVLNRDELNSLLSGAEYNIMRTNHGDKIFDVYGCFVIVEIDTDSFLKVNMYIDEKTDNMDYSIVAKIKNRNNE